MKYSIITLLAATAYIALAIAALKEPLSWWLSASTIAWLLVLAYLIASSADSANRRSALFGRAALVCILAYGLLTWLPVSLASDLEHPRLGNAGPAPTRIAALPHHWFAPWWTETPPLQAQPTTANSYGGNSFDASYLMPKYSPWILPQTKAVEFLAALNCALIFGLLGGSIALWRYRRNEKAHRESGGP